MKLAICLIVKDEVTDIAYWIIHHICLGFDHIFVYDNLSTDGTRAILDILSGQFPITVIPWAPTNSDNPRATQGTAYDHCLTAMAAHYDWVAVLDADEYLIPQAGQNIREFLATFKQPSAVALNWRLFGSAGIINNLGVDPLIAFTRRATDEYPTQSHVKCFVRPRDYEGVLNPHAFKLNGICVDVNGSEVVWSKAAGVGCVEHDTICFGSITLHHYVTRSYAHWQRRCIRGNWTSSRTLAEFRMLDRNEVLDISAINHGERTRIVLNAISHKNCLDNIVESFLSSPMMIMLNAAANRFAAELQI